MNTLEEAINHLSRNWQPFKNIKSFSDKPGIYSIVYHGSDFPDLQLKSAFTKGRIIYIGKTESSQEARDANTHFASGKTGSSTLRKSIGSLLKTVLRLQPIPRNTSDLEAGRTSQFKFTEDSEVKLTEWMHNNLGMGYYPFTGSKDLLDILETGLIKHFTPVLNIDKNRDNPYLEYIRLSRKKCAEEAYRNKNIDEIPRFTNYRPESNVKRHDGRSSKNGSALYVEIWESAMPRIVEGIKKAVDSISASIQFDPTGFKQAGDRQTYSFRIEYKDLTVTNNLGGSAVARDLNKVIFNEPRVLQLLKNHHIVFQFNTSFVLTISCYQ